MADRSKYTPEEVAKSGAELVDYAIFFTLYR